jgi:predicted nuclease of predicted toxin-antitoxin system
LTLQECRFLTDENIHPEVVAWLRAAGCDVLDVKEAGLAGADDVSLLRRAAAEGRVMLTHDSDFGTLAIAAAEPTAGIVYLRPGHIRSEFTIRTLAALLSREVDLAGAFVIVAEATPSTVRIRLRRL